MESISCQEDVLQITVGNKGEGPLKNMQESLMSVAIEGNAWNEVPLANATNAKNGGIESPGGESVYLTAFSLDRIIRVDIVIDPAGVIVESDEDNNSHRNIYVAPCNLPDLVVEEISLDDGCQILIKVKNKGDGDVPYQAWSYDFMDYCGVSLSMNDKETACVPFISIDPEKKLRQVGEAIEIESGIRIKTETLVTAIVDSTLNVNETDETNNKKSVRLKCGT